MEVLLIDTSIVLYKIGHSIAKHVKVNGIPYDVSPLIGLPKIIQGTEYETIYFVIDGFPKPHLDLYSAYKGNRNYEFNGVHPIPLKTQLSYLHSYAKLKGIDVRFLCTPHNEADQVISSYLYAYHQPHLRNFHTTMSLEEDKWLSDCGFTNPVSVSYNRKIDKFVILTTDSDIYQVQVVGNVHIANDIRGIQSFKGSTPVAVSGVNPATIAVYKALMGDSSDNIPNTVTRSAANERAIADILDNEQCVGDFIKSLRIRKPMTSPSLKPIYKDLFKGNNLRQFFVNYQLTKLSFTSLPYEVVPELVDVFEVRSKYGFK